MVLTKEQALVLATEALRGVGLEQEAKWVENAGAVRQLLSHPPTESSEDGPECERPLLICRYCQADSLSSSALSQRLTCDVCGRVQSYEEARR